MAGALSQAELQSILEFTVALARKAGELILEGSEAIRASGAVDEKKNSVDLVTEYDVRVEELVKRELSAQYPTFKLCVSSRHSDLLLHPSATCAMPPL